MKTTSLDKNLKEAPLTNMRPIPQCHALINENITTSLDTKLFHENPNSSFENNRGEELTFVEVFNRHCCLL